MAWHFHIHFECAMSKHICKLLLYEVYVKKHELANFILNLNCIDKIRTAFDCDKCAVENVRKYDI